MFGPNLVFSIICTVQCVSSDISCYKLIRLDENMGQLTWDQCVCCQDYSETNKVPRFRFAFGQKEAGNVIFPLLCILGMGW